MRIKFQRCLLQTACKSCKICVAPIIILNKYYLCCNLPIFVMLNTCKIHWYHTRPINWYLGKMAGSFYRGFWRVVHHLGGSSCSLKICCLRFIVMDILDGRNGIFYCRFGVWRELRHLGGSSCSLKICCLRFIVIDILDGRNGIFYWRFGVWRELRHLGGRSCSLNYAPTSTDYCPTPITLSINGLTHADHQPAFLGHDRTQ